MHEAGRLALSPASDTPISFVDAATVADALLHILARAPEPSLCGRAYNVAQEPPISLGRIISAATSPASYPADWERPEVAWQKSGTYSANLRLLKAEPPPDPFAVAWAEAGFAPPTSWCRPNYGTPPPRPEPRPLGCLRVFDTLRLPPSTHGSAAPCAAATDRGRANLRSSRHRTLASVHAGHRSHG